MKVYSALVHGNSESVSFPQQRGWFRVAKH